MFSKEQKIFLLETVCLSPSAHNTQPLLWNFDDNKIIVSFNPERTLPYADPTNRDLYISAGAAIFTMKLALKTIGFDAVVKITTENTSVAILHCFEAEIDEDLLFKYLELRHTYRGKFRKASIDEIQHLKTEFINQHDVQLIFDKNQMKNIAKRYDDAAYSFFKDPSYLGELNHWLRFSHKDPYYAKDGLNYESMAMSKFEAYFAKKILRPSFFQKLNRAGLAKTMTSEMGKITTSTCFVVVYGPSDEHPIYVGKRLMKVWLQATRAGFSFCPMSSLIDVESERKKLEQELQVSENRRIIGMYRCGPSPESFVAKARLPIHEQTSEQL